MKKFTFILICFLSITILSAQESEEFSKKGKILVEAGYNLGSVGSGGTGLGIFAYNGETISSVGLDVGYFTSENFALKLQLSLLSASSISVTNIMVGGKYYIVGKVPIEFGIGFIRNNNDYFEATTEELGKISIGYGIKLAQNINLEPTIGFLLNSEESIFKFGMNFAMFL